MTTQEHHSSVWDAVIFRGRTTEILCCAVRALTWLSREVHMHAGPFLFTVLEQRAGRHKIMQIPLCVLSHFTNKAPIMSFVRRTYLYCKYFTLSARDPPCDCVCSGRERLTSLQCSEILIARAV
jgi:hypothetical protein